MQSFLAQDMTFTNQFPDLPNLQALELYDIGTQIVAMDPLVFGHAVYIPQHALPQRGSCVTWCGVVWRTGH